MRCSSRMWSNDSELFEKNSRINTGDFDRVLYAIGGILL
jgi:hypothetical protein